MALDIGVFLDSVKNLFKAKVSSNDTQPDYLINKFTSSDASVTITETNDGGVEQINLQSSGGGGGGGNFADTDLTVDADRTHDLNDFNLTFENPTDDAVNSSKILHEWNFFSTGTLRDLVSYSDSSHLTGIKIKGGSQFGLYMEQGGNTISRMYRLGSVGILSLENSGTSGVYFNGSNANASYVAGYLNVGYLSISKPASLSVKGKGSTSATTALLVENSSGTDLLKLDDDGTFELKNGTYTNFYAQGSTNRLSIGMGATTDPTAYLTIRNANGNTHGLLLQDSSGNDMAWLGGAFTAFFHSGANDDYHLFTNSAGITKFEQYHSNTNIMAFRSNGTSFMTGNFSVGANVTASATLDVHGHIAIDDGVTAPSSTSGKAKLYVDSADGDLKVIFGDGTVKTIVTDS